jgi:hypothetical protein
VDLIALAGLDAETGDEATFAFGALRHHQQLDLGYSRSGFGESKIPTD